MLLHGRNWPVGVRSDPSSAQNFRSGTRRTRFDLEQWNCPVTEARSSPDVSQLYALYIREEWDGDRGAKQQVLQSGNGRSTPNTHACSDLQVA